MLKKQIGTDAGVVWKLLLDNGKLSMRQVGELSSLSGDRISLAIGWLARESKVFFKEERGVVYAELMQADSHFYF